MVVLNFIWYCIQCMFSCFTAMFGHIPNGFTLKDGLVGVATLIVIILIIFLILRLTWVIKFKKKKIKEFTKQNKDANEKTKS